MTDPEPQKKDVRGQHVPLSETLSEASYKHHFELLDRYQAFSAEVLRLSLVTVGALGFFLSAKDGVAARLGQKLTEGLPLCVLIAAMLALSVAAGLAICHRYVSSDVMYYILRAYHRPLSQKEEAARDRMFDWSELAIVASPICLGAGVFLLAVTFSLAMLPP